MTRPLVDITLLRALQAEQSPARNGERAAAARLLAARLIETVGTPVEWGRKRPSRVLRLTARGEAEVAKLPKPRSLMLMGHGDRFDCAYAAACIGVFADEYPTATEAHCPPKCAHRKDVRREAAGGSSPLAEMQRYAPGEI